MLKKDSLRGAHLGGIARAKKLSPERKREIAMMGVKARLAKKKAVSQETP